MVSGYSGSWSVYVKDLKNGGTILINDTSMYPASTIKAFVMASTYDHDIAIVYGKKTDYVICVFSHNGGSSSSRIRAISQTVYKALNP
ncbi:MAG: hypothetical protein IJW67_13600 [Blautia sp.]|nr:hypothetical protein [Blautia sp.]